MVLKDRDKAILEFIKRFMLENGFTPTMREICEGVGMSSTSSVFMHFERLVELGYIIKRDKRYTLRGMKYVEWDEPPCEREMS